LEEFNKARISIVSFKDCVRRLHPDRRFGLRCYDSFEFTPNVDCVRSGGDYSPCRMMSHTRRVKIITSRYGTVCEYNLCS
ncbi:hypothetical protein, partial [Methanoculleus sp. UBA208]|uniref:hypothetical protein n=1 Tax=Methanoculleus sp. UBA208 TaxID=1915494 RepID=UPI0025E57F01